MKSKLSISFILVGGLILSSLSSCGSRRPAFQQQASSVNVQAPKYVPQSGKELRLMKKANRKGVLNY